MKLIAICLLLVSLVTPTWAFLYELELLTAEEIDALSNEQLEESYSEAMIEEKASAEFHQAAGFSSAKDYEKRKDLLRYIILLRKEMAERDMEIDPIEEWIQ